VFAASHRALLGRFESIIRERTDIKPAVRFKIMLEYINPFTRSVLGGAPWLESICRKVISRVVASPVCIRRVLGVHEIVWLGDYAQ